MVSQSVIRNLNTAVDDRRSAQKEVTLWANQATTAPNLRGAYQSLSELEAAIADMRSAIIREQAAISGCSRSEAIAKLEMA